MRTDEDKRQFEQMLQEARAKVASQTPASKKPKKEQPPKRLLHNIGHPWGHITGG